MSGQARTMSNRRPSSSQPEGGPGPMRHMGMAYPLAAGIGGGAWLGHRWDTTSQHEVPWGTAVCSLLGLAASFSIIFRSLNR